MVFRQIKSISKETVKALEGMEEKIQFLKIINDADFLFSDIDSDSKNLKSTENIEEEIEVSKDIGIFTKRKYELRHFIYRKPSWDDNIKNLKFVMMQPSGTAAYFNENIPCVAIKLVKAEEDKNVLNLGLYYEKANRNRANATAKNGNIIELAQFFYFRRSLYKSIHEVLLKNREEFEKISNHFFVNDLISLFSVPSGPKKQVNFNIPLENIKEEFYSRKIKGKNLTYLYSMLYYSRKKAWKKKIPKYSSEIFLDKKGHLIIESSLFEIDAGKGEDEILKIKKEKSFIKFLNKTNDCLLQMNSMINFAYDIYKKNEGKILTSTI